MLTNTSNSSKKSTFNFELCQTLLLAHILLNKLNNERFRTFLVKYIKVDSLDELTLRKNYVDLCSNDIIQKIRDYIGNKKNWVSMDETTDIEGRYVVNVIIGILKLENPGKIFLLHTNVLKNQWPLGIKHGHVLLFLSDTDPYLVKAGKVIQNLYSKIIHVTCITHAIHRMAEEIRTNFQGINKLISSVKKVFLKAPYRIQIFKTIVPGISLNPHFEEHR